MMRSDHHFWPTMLSLAECLCQQITDSELPDVCFCGVLPGDLTLEYCTSCDGGACGQAWVRLVGVSVLAGVEEAANPCTAPLQALVEVGIARCAPTGGDDGSPPTLAQQLDAAALQTADMAAALRAIRCCEALSPKDFAITQWTPIGPEGVCLGGAWAVLLFEGDSWPP
jgi:hypothetical protein